MRLRKPKYVLEFKDRHGKTRRYLRRRGYPLTPLPGEGVSVWSTEFANAYDAAMRGEPLERKVERRHGTGTLGALTIAYLNSPEFKGLRETSQKTYRGIVERFGEEHGHRPVVGLTREKIKELMARKAATPAAANRWLKIVRTLMRLAIELGLRADDPTLHVKPFIMRGGGFTTWPETHIVVFREKYHTGTRARLAFELLYGTMQRRSDVVRMGRQHVRDGQLSIKQQKTGAQVDIPLLPEVLVELAHLPAGQMTFLLTEQNKPFTAAGFGGYFRKLCDDAGIPVGYSAHGLRKAGAVRLAERGATTKEIMAWGGWETIKEVQTYTKAVDRKRLAERGYAKITKRTESDKPE